MRPAAVILAGGAARRMGGGDKALLTLAGRPLLDHVIARLAPQVSALALNANGDPARFAAWPLPVLPDQVPDKPGPLAGILAGMVWATRVDPAAATLITVPADTPFIPIDLVERLINAHAQAEVAMAARHGRAQPVIALWDTALAKNIAAALAAGAYGVEAFARSRRHVLVAFDEGHDPFFNINTPEDLAAAAQDPRLRTCPPT